MLMVLSLECAGEVEIEDVDKKKTAHLKHGDIVHIQPGSNIRWGSPTTGNGISFHFRHLVPIECNI